MRERRFLIPKTAWREGRAVFDKAGAHHARRVLRLKPGDRITVVDGEGGAFYGLLAEDADGVLFGGELHPLALNGEPRDFVALAPALAKGEKLDTVCEKATECGAAEFRPALTAHAEGPSRAFSSLRPRLEKIVLAAVQQCGRSRLPALHEPAPLAALPFGEFDEILFAHPGDHPPLNALAPTLEPARGGRFLILTGPEGGFSPEETAALVARGAQPFALGPRILRTETAGPLAVFAFLAARGNL